MPGRWLALLVLAALSCSSKEDAAKPPPVAPKSTGADAATQPPAPTPPPAVVSEPTQGTHVALSLLGRYKDPAFGAAGLPATSADGSRVAYGEELLDGGRGNPNYRLVIRDVARDRPLVVKELLAPSPRWTPEDEPVVRGRIDEANRLLAKTTWTALTPMIAGADDVLGALRGGGHEVLVRGRQLVVLAGGRVVVRRPLAGLLKTNAGCPGKVLLAEAYVDTRTIVVRFQFETDGCWREAEYHVLRLARPAPTPSSR